MVLRGTTPFSAWLKVKDAGERRPMVFGGTWHTDSAFLARPPSVSMLYAVDVPPFGGDTWYANTQLAYAF